MAMCAIVLPPVHGLGLQTPPSKLLVAAMHRWLVAGALYATEYPGSHVKSHDWPAEPLHVVGELASDDDSHPTISQEPPRNHLSDPQTWLPLGSYPRLHVKLHTSPVLPEHVVGELVMEVPKMQLSGVHCAPLSCPFVPHTWDAPTAFWYPSSQTYSHAAP